MARYIDADKLLEEMTLNVLPDNARFVYLAMRGMVRNAPTADVVEVVRCKDCEYYSSVTKYSGEPMHYGYCCNTHDSVLGNRHRYERDFCSYGERKDT